MNFKKQQLKGVEIHDAPQVGTRTVNILMGEHANEFVRGDIMDANAVIQAFDELKGNVDTNHDTLEELVNEIHANTEGINNANTQIQKVDSAIKAEATTRKSEDDAIKNLLQNEVTRATTAETTIQGNIDNEAAERKASDNTITTNLNNEIARAKAAEKDNKDRLDILDGDSSTEGSFRKAIADLIDAAPEDFDTLKEIADKLADNDDLHTALNQAITEKADASALANEVTRATAAEATLQNSFDQFVSKTATKEQFGVVKVGDGINVTDGTISVDKSSILIDLLSYGVEWDITVADPACTRIGNMSYHKSLPIQSEYKGCLVKNGKVNYYLDPNDWSKKADGTSSVLDGTDGDVMVHIPKFYGKSGSNGNKRWVRIATTKIDSSWVEIPEMFVSAYKITTYTDSGTAKVASVVNTTTKYRGGSNRSNYDQYLSTDKFRTDLGKSRTSINRAKMRTAATNSGQELLCYEFYKWVFYWAYVIEYANFNSQKEFNSELTSDGYHQGGLGYGVSKVGLGYWDNYNRKNTIVPCGYTNEFGNFSGTKNIIIQADDSSPITVTANRWRGFENPFGDIETCLDGIVLKMDSANSESKVYTTNDSSKFGDDTSVMNIAGIEESDIGYIIEFDLRETGEIIPQSSENYPRYGSIYKCDFHSLNTDNTNNRMLLVGGDAQFGDMNGLGSFSSDNVDYASSRFGYRSVIRA